MSEEGRSRVPGRCGVPALLLSLALLAFWAPDAIAAPGDLDTTFSGDGLVKTDFGFGGTDQPLAVDLQPDGKIIEVGPSNISAPQGDFALVRLNTNGSLDSTFANRGNPATDFGGFDYALDVAVRPDGKFVVAGATCTNQTRESCDAAIARYNSDGSLDTTFSGDGKLIDSASTVARGVALQPDGKVVLTGDDTQSGFQVSRLTSSGALDTTFSDDGHVTADFGLFGGSDFGQDVTVQSDGGVVAVGSAGSGFGAADLAVARFTSSGSPDPSFSADGYDTVDVDNQDEATTVAIDGNGKILVGGGSGEGNSYGQATVVRYNSDGSLDASLAGDGTLATSFGGESERVDGLAVAPDGKIVISGNSSVPNPNDPNDASDLRNGVARLNSDGTADTSFSGDGRDVSVKGFGSTGVSVQSDGRVVAAALVSDDPIYFGFGALRYTASGALDTTFSGDGIQTIKISRSESSAGLTNAPGGKLVAGASVRAGEGGGDFAAVRYDSGGSLDTTFSDDGRVTADFGTLRDEARDTAVQSDGKVVVAGTVFNPVTEGERNLGLVRFNADGTPDTGFSGDGKLVADLTEDDDVAAVAVQEDGKVIVSEGDAVARFKADGSLDSDWAGDGTRAFPGSGLAGAIALQPDGKLLVSAGDDLVRLNPDGSTDTSFGVAGVVSGVGFGESAVLSDGRIVTLGQPNGEGEMQIRRLTPSGASDATFSGDGVAGLGSLQGFSELAVQPNGRILIAGVDNPNAEDSDEGDVQIARLTASGALDASFSGDGVQVTNAGDDDTVDGLVLQGDRAIVGGSTGGPAYQENAGPTETDLLLAGYDATSPPDTTPPNTTITGGPSGTTADSTPTFTFASSEFGSRFECKVDGAAFSACTSPSTVGPLSNGQHTFQARAIDQSDNTDQSPATRTFSVAVSPPKPPDSDGDGKPNASDACPTVKGTLANGCPPAGAGSTPLLDPPSIGGSKSPGSVRSSSKGSFNVPKQSVDCTGAGPDCRVTTSVGATVTTSRRRKVKLGSSSFKVPAGKKGKVRVKLTKKGRSLLKRKKKIKVKIAITVKRGSATRKKTVTVTLKAPRKPKR